MRLLHCSFSRSFLIILNFQCHQLIPDPRLLACRRKPEADLPERPHPRELPPAFRKSDADMNYGRFNVMTGLTLLALAVPIAGLAFAYFTYGTLWGVTGGDYGLVIHP